ncbi:MAG: monovalent cation/H+ antiporter complex subunit F [Sedimenticolaceae bacterium]|nr:monovalent cation/H+ antiporter complex subunit F [Sedimenticolaceae bacterium]
MNETLLLTAALLLFVTLITGLIRALIGPSLQDRMLSIQLLGTGGVALLILLGLLQDIEALVDAALVLALLAAVAAAALTRREARHD